MSRLKNASALVSAALFAIVLCIPVPAGAVALPGITYQYIANPPDLGDAGDRGPFGEESPLLDGNLDCLSGSVAWTAGSGKCLEATIDLDLHGTYPIDRVRLVSMSAWWLCQTPHVKITGKLASNGEWVSLVDQDWFTRRQDEPLEIAGGIQGRKFDLSVPAEGRRLTHVRLTVSRPRSDIIMVLTEIEVHVRGAVALNIRPNWLTYRVGQTIKQYLFIDNSTGNVIKNMRVDVLLRSLDTHRILARAGHFYIPEVGPGMNQASASYPVNLQPGKYEMYPNLVSPEAKDFKLYSVHSSEEITILPKMSKYYFPIGTTDTDGTVQHYGAAIMHNWFSVPLIPGGIKDGTGDKLIPISWDTVADGLPNSVVNVMSWIMKGPEELGVPDEQLFLYDEEGNIIKDLEYSAYQPAGTRELRPDVIERLQYWDGHPGYYDNVYNNEHSYVTWARGGKILDYNPNAIKSFRRYVQNLHGDIGTLNRLYSTSYQSFDEVEPPRVYPGPSAAWYDWLQFRKIGLANQQKVSYNLMKQYLKQVPLDFKAIGYDCYASSSAIDAYLWRDACDIYGIDIYMFVRDGYDELAWQIDFLRTQVGMKPIHLLESGCSWQGPSPTIMTGFDWNLTWWPGILRGVAGINFFYWKPTDEFPGMRLAPGPDRRLNERAHEVTKMFKQVQTLSPVLNSSRLLGVEIAVYYPSEDIDQLPNVAPVNSVMGAHKLLTQIHYPVDIISSHNIRDGELSKYKVLVLPGAQHLTPEVAGAVKEFVRNGGLLIADMRAGFYDQYHQEVRQLEDVLGIKSVEARDDLTRISLSPSSSIALPNILTEPSPFSGKSLHTTAPLPRAEVIAVSKNATVTGTFPNESMPSGLQTGSSQYQGRDGVQPGLPAIVEHRFGKGSSLYLACRFFNAYRNYHYTQNLPPYPVTRAHELENQGDPVMRTTIERYLSQNGIKPPVEVDVSIPYLGFNGISDSHFQMFSYWGNDDCMLLGIGNWGPSVHYNVPVTVQLPFDNVRAVYCMETYSEKMYPIEYKMTGRRLTCNLPQLIATNILIVVGNSGPLLAFPAQQQVGGPVKVRLVNHLPETAEGTVEIRLDGVGDRIGDKVSFNLAKGAQGLYTINLNPADKKILYEADGEGKPLYVWVTYDGTARSFARVRMGDCQ